MNQEWLQTVEDDLAESPIDEAAVASVEEEIRRLYDEETRVWHTDAWAFIDEYLGKEFARESAIIFTTNDPNELMLARERGRVISRLRKRPQEVAARLQELARQRRILVGEEESSEE